MKENNEIIRNLKKKLFLLKSNLCISVMKKKYLKFKCMNINK